MSTPTKSDGQVIELDTVTESSQQERVLASALEVFSREGFEGASTRQIAAGADCNHAMIRYYFGSKDELWRAAVSFLFERSERELAIEDTLRTALLAGERQAFEEWIRRYVGYCARHPDHARIMVQASIRDDDRLAWAAGEYIKRQHSEMRPVLYAMMNKGVLPRFETTLHVGYILVSACQMLFTLAPEVRLLHGVDVTDPAIIARHADTVISIMLR